MWGKLYSINYNILALYKIDYLYNFLFSNLKIKSYIVIYADLISKVFLIINLLNSFIEFTIKKLSKITLTILYLIL